jgi:ATP synthase protein I
MMHPMWRTLFYQLLLLASLLLVFGLAWPVGLESAVWGGLLFIVPQWYFTHYAFRYRGAKNAPWIARSFYQGQSGKMLLTAMGFALVWRFAQPDPAVLFGVYGVFLLAQWWIASLVITEPKP